MVGEEAESRLIKMNASESEARKSKLSQQLRSTEEKMRIPKFIVKIVNAGNQTSALC